MTNDSDKDIKIETDEDVGLDDKIKAGAKALGKKIEDPDRDTGTEYEKEKLKERVVDWLIRMIKTPIAITAIFLATTFVLSIVTNSAFAQAESMNQSMNNASANSTTTQTTTNTDEKLNQTGEAIQGNASKIGSKITEGAKDIVGNIGKGLENLGK